VIGECLSTQTVNCTSVGAPIYAATAGKRESGSPTYTYGLRLQGDIGPLSLAAQGKVTGPRYLNDQNLPNLQCTASLVNQVCPTLANTTGTTTAFAGTRGFVYQVYGPKAPAYGTIDIDARLKLGFLGLNDKTFFQVNVQNIFNKYYVGGFTGGSTTQFSLPFVQIGSPRAFIGTLNFQF
jgi:iron complex outermembrane receptor protein